MFAQNNAQPSASSDDQRGQGYEAAISLLSVPKGPLLEKCGLEAMVKNPLGKKTLAAHVGTRSQEKGGKSSHTLRKSTPQNFSLACPAGRSELPARGQPSA